MQRTGKEVTKQGSSRTTSLACFRDHIPFAIIVILDLKIHQKYVDTLTLFSKNLNQRSLTPRWPLTPCLLRSHVWLYPRIIVSKSHEQYINVCGYSDQFCKIPHTYYIHTTYRMSDHIVSYWTQFRRDNKLMFTSKIPNPK